MLNQLLAKSQHSDQRILTVEQHLLDTEQAASEIFRLDKRWGCNWCRFFKIYSVLEQEKFLLNLRIAALFHDLGKANEEFQKAVAPGFYQQSIRHEHFSALILLLPEVREWLGNNSNLDIDVITAAVLSHHLKASADEWCNPKGKKLVNLYLTHPEVKAILVKIKEIAKLDREPPNVPTEPWSPESIWQRLLENSGLQLAKKFKRDFKNNNNRHSLLLAVKAGLIAADALASTKFREKLKFEEWVSKYIHTKPIRAEDVEQEILQPFAKDYQQRKNKKFELWDFQGEVAKKGSRVLLMTACGSGKTRGAWEWLKEQCCNREIGKLIFLYPTRATALQGFIGYTAWGGNDAAHLSGTAQYEIEMLQDNPTESTKDNNFQLSESEARLFALGYWGRRYLSGTVDQFMSFLEHNYKAMCLLPVLADAAIVLDEVHSYDQRMFNSLIAFLKEFDVPVLCMTATLPNSRKAQLLEKLVEFPTQEERLKFQELQVTEDKPRYQLEIIEESEALSRAVKAYQENKYRVLWVVNQVAKCQAKADELEKLLKEKEPNLQVLSYHSQFLLGDRQDIHQEIIKKFSPPEKENYIKSAIAVTTQICEMSLDLDADFLITELANVCALVQRFGRANRHMSRGDNFRAKLLVYIPKDGKGKDDIKPYTKEEIQIALAFVAELNKMGDLSQRQLAEKLESHAAKEPLADGWTRFLSEGYYATPGDYRDIAAFRQTCVLDRDIKGELPILEVRIKAKRAFDDLIISVPNKPDCILNLKDERPNWLPKWLKIAPAAKYCSRRGFRA